MLMKPELIVSMWFVPVVLFFVLPVLFFPLIMRLAKKSAAQAQPVILREAVALPPGSATANDQRAFPRERLDGIIAHVSDGIRCCRGAIADISTAGVCLVSPKGALDRNAETLGVLLTGSGESVHMLVRPRWNKDFGEDLNIGASIEETLGNWNLIAKQGEGRQLASAA